MRRRAFLAAIGSTAAIPFTATVRAQQDRVRRIGVLQTLGIGADARLRLAAFEQGLKQAGWTPGHNLTIDYRMGMAAPDRARRDAKDIVSSAPDIIFAPGSTAVGALLEITRSIPPGKRLRLRL
jgi:putative ABC transport system substrate-binding protein